MTAAGKRGLQQRLRRFRRLWKAAGTEAELGDTGPAVRADVPPANQYWMTERLPMATDAEGRRKAVHGYVLQTLGIAEVQAVATGDVGLQAEVDHVRSWLAECGLAAVVSLEQAQRAGGHQVVAGRLSPNRYRAWANPEPVVGPDPVDLDAFTSEGKQR